MQGLLSINCDKRGGKIGFVISAIKQLHLNCSVIGNKFYGTDHYISTGGK